MSPLELEIASWVFGVGCLGGLVAGLLDPPWEPERPGWWGWIRQLLPYTRDMCGKWQPGFLLSVLIGGVAALVSWCLYGPFSGTSLVGDNPHSNGIPYLTYGQLATSLLVGIGGPAFLLTEARRRCSESREVDPRNSHKEP